MNFAEEIKARIKMPELLKHYGIEINRAGRIRCPLHGGKDFNCGVKDNYLHCFVCGESVDQIGFVQKYYGLSFQESLAKINYDFNLGLPVGQKIGSSQRLAMAKSNYERLKRKRQEEERANLLDEAYWSAYDEVLRLSKNKADFAPKSPEEEPHPLFVEATIYLEEARQRLFEADVERYKYEHRDRKNS